MGKWQAKGHTDRTLGSYGLGSPLEKLQHPKSQCVYCVDLNRGRVIAYNKWTRRWGYYILIMGKQSLCYTAGPVGPFSPGKQSLGHTYTNGESMFDIFSTKCQHSPSVLSGKLCYLTEPKAMGPFTWFYLCGVNTHLLHNWLAQGFLCFLCNAR